MKKLGSAIIILGLYVAIVVTSLTIHDTYFNEESPIIGQLVERAVELEIIVADQATTIRMQQVELQNLEESRKDFWNTALELKSENHALVMIIKEMEKIMLEMLQELEGREDRNT